jgi:hypothetical protein
MRNVVFRVGNHGLFDQLLGRVGDFAEAFQDELRQFLVNLDERRVDFGGVFGDVAVALAIAATTCLRPCKIRAADAGLF